MFKRLHSFSVGFAAAVTWVAIATSPLRAAPAEQAASAQYTVPTFPPSPARGYLFHPAGPRTSESQGGFRLALGMLFDNVDSRPIQGVHAPFPLLTLDARYQFKNQISLLAHFQAIWVLNQVEVGVGWSARAGNTGIMPYVTGGSLLGTLNQGGFKSFTAAPLIHPGIRLGWSISDMRLTFDGSALFIPSQYVALGDSSLWTSQFPAFTGLQGLLTLENPLNGGGIIFFGLGALWMRGWYQTWLFFSDDPSLLLYSRVFLGYAF